MSWSLFKKMAFRPGQELHSPLSAIGKEIVRKCAGVPLAIRALGSFLYDKDTETEWLFVKNNQLSEMAHGDNNEILAILKLSYDHLPSHLKQCFAYCAVFGKDQVIDKRTLVQLWAAQGYIKSTGEQNQDQEQVGDQYFRDLVRRSFFQNVKQDRWGYVTSCKMHDLIHDLARLITDGEVSVPSLNAKSGVESTLHISFDSALDLPHEFPAHFLKANTSRTILLPVRPWDSLEECRRNVDVIISSFRRLRVLDLHALAIKKLSNSIGRLRQLRYIDLSNNDFVVLPRSTTQLVNLQTLKLSFCYDLEELPEDIHNMVSLRHLELDECVNLTHMPCGIRKLTCLRTLSYYVIAKDSSSSGVNAGLEELRDLINLQGELRIRNLGCATIEETGKKLIMNKEHLQSLRLEWGVEANGAENPEQLLEVLQPHANLKKLFIEKYRGFSFPTWIMTGIGSSLANLTKITFKNCDNCQRLPPFGQLTSLQLLKLESLSSLEYMEFCDRNDHQSECSPQQKWARTRSADYFPSLIEMKLYDLPCLKGWRNVEVASTTGEIVSLPLLSKLTIKDCPKLVFMPINPCLEELVLIRVNEKLVEQQLGMSMKHATTTTFPASCTLSRLKYLLILDIQNLISLPDSLQNFTLLEHLELSCCPLLHIPELAIRTLTKLRFLQIHDCGLTSLFKGMHHLINLETLVISNCKELDLSGDDNDEHVPFRCPRRLGTLNLQEIPKLVTLPIWLQGVTSLQVLNIEKCYNLLALPEWISKLSSLESLLIYKCYRLKSLPLGMSCLTSLQELRILMCPHLYETCQHEGEDWPKVAHIPKFTVK